MKGIYWLATSLDDLKAFPSGVKQDAGFELHQIQCGLEPSDWKPMTAIGKGVKEIRLRDTSGQYRVMYIANRGHAIYVLHAFQKKTQKTRKADIELAKTRLKEVPDD